MLTHLQGTLVCCTNRIRLTATADLFAWSAKAPTPSFLSSFFCFYSALIPHAGPHPPLPPRLSRFLPLNSYLLSSPFPFLLSQCSWREPASRRLLTKAIHLRIDKLRPCHTFILPSSSSLSFSASAFLHCKRAERKTSPPNLSSTPRHRQYSPRRIHFVAASPHRSALVKHVYCVDSSVVPLQNIKQYASRTRYPVTYATCASINFDC